ncbi:hypothetical protein ALQ97_200025 [Pseudomonas savastanoi pv. glycinea]|nr:hypothetical protein ALQ97_200025 [Pseudomonas savastanoi pv. glycinea]
MYTPGNPLFVLRDSLLLRILDRRPLLLIHMHLLGVFVVTLLEVSRPHVFQVLNLCDCISDIT